MLYLKYPEPVTPPEPVLAGYLTTVTIPSADTPAEFAPGSFLVNSTNGMIPFASGGDVAALQIISQIMDAYGRVLESSYVAAAPAVDYKVQGYPVGNIIFRATEDALVTPITNANSGSGAAVYADLIVNAIDVSGQGLITPFSAQPVILINSDTVNASSSGLGIQLLGLAPAIDQPPYSATAAASPRTFLFKFISPQLSIPM